MYTEELKIPKGRVAVLIGKMGKDKRTIELKTKTKIKINSKEGDAIIEGEDGLNCYLTKSILQAIARGFNPTGALKLLDEDYCYESLDLKEFTRKTEKDQRRVKARVIGSKGKAKIFIENKTNTDLSIYGKTVGIIGKIEDVQLAKQALINLVQGSKHGKVYGFIERTKKKSLSTKFK